MTDQPDQPDQPGAPLEVVVGRVGKPHGVRGEVTLELRTDEPARRFVVGAELLAERPAGSTLTHDRLTVGRARWHQQTLLVSFEELGDRTAAEAARGVVLSTVVDATERPDDPEEFYDHQLVGLAVVDTDGRPLGELAAVRHGAQDLLVVATPDGREALVPFVAALVPEVDLDGGRVVVADRPGLVTPFPDAAG